MTAHHWRAIRARITSTGIANPLTLPSLHALLDQTENLVGASYETADERTRFMDRLYAPEIGKDLNDAGYKPKPSGFDDDAEVEASFDAFMAAAL